MPDLAESAVVAIDIAILSLLFLTALGVARSRDLFAVAILSGVYSLLSALFFLRLDAVDVAFTEAAVGAGISTVVILAALILAQRREAPHKGRMHRYVAIAVCFSAGLALFYATFDMPAFGDPNSPANSGVGMAYLERTYKDIGIPNVVSAVLASYRGFDTLGEVVVVFTAGVGVTLILAPRKRDKHGGVVDKEETPNAGTPAQLDAQGDEEAGP
jgi:multicomponent Na+:H+ antiporter subunit B